MSRYKHIFILLIIFLCLSTCNSNSEKNFTFANNVVIAHRGAWKTDNLPQNSIASLRKAIDLGCTGSEFDVRMTSDDVLIVTHDGDYHGLEVELSTYSELSKYKLPNGEILPTLEDFIKAGLTKNDSTGLVCEIKPSKYEDRNAIITEKVVNLVKSLNAENHILAYISFSYEILKKIQEIDAHAKTQYLDGSKNPEELKADGISGLDYLVYKLKIHPEWITSAKEKGLILNAWVANKTEDIDWLLANDFDYLTTDEPELVFQQVKKSPTKGLE